MVFRKYLSWQIFFLILIFYSYNLQASHGDLFQQIKEHKKPLLIFGIVIFGGFGIQHWLNKKKHEIEKIKEKNSYNEKECQKIIQRDPNQTDDEDTSEIAKKIKNSNYENIERINNFFCCQLI
jgi:hypothetical protein